MFLLFLLGLFPRTLSCFLLASSVLEDKNASFTATYESDKSRPGKYGKLAQGSVEKQERLTFFFLLAIVVWFYGSEETVWDVGGGSMPWATPLEYERPGYSFLFRMQVENP